MKKSVITFALAAQVATSTRGAAQPRLEPSYPLDQAPARLTAGIEIADAAIRALQQRLSARLLDEMKKGGPARAISVCRDEAQALTAEIARVQGVRVGRTSDRLRNPGNAAPSWAERFVEASAGRKAASVEATVVDLGDRVGVLRPIPTATPCLQAMDTPNDCPPTYGLSSSRLTRRTAPSASSRANCADSSGRKRPPVRRLPLRIGAQERSDRGANRVRALEIGSFDGSLRLGVRSLHTHQPARCLMKARAGVLLLSGAALTALSTFDVAALQSPATVQKPAPLVIQVGVDLIQIDASVTDEKGRPVADLKAEDFILEVDGKKQPLTNAAYFGLVQGAGAAAHGGPASPQPGVGNTVIFIVDDLNMSFGSMYYARRGLRRFASEWRSSGTRAAIRTTSEVADSFTLFTSAEPFESKAAELRYNINSNQGFRSVRPMTREGSRVTAGMSPDVQAAFAANTNPSVVSSNLRQRLFSLVSTINTMRSLPGRKALVFVSEGFASLSTGAGPLGFDSPLTTLFTVDSDVREAMRLITEVANRASVVLYTVDPRGLFADFPSAEDDPDAALIGSMMQTRWFDRVHTQGSLQELAGATGGLAVINRNDLQGGFSDILRDQSAYYLIGFEPTEKTFVKSSGRAKFHKIKLRVNRPDVRVRTRAGFYGVTDEEVNSRAPMPLTAPETY